MTRQPQQNRADYGPGTQKESRPQSQIPNAVLSVNNALIQLQCALIHSDLMTGCNLVHSNNALNQIGLNLLVPSQILRAGQRAHPRSSPRFLLDTSVLNGVVPGHAYQCPPPLWVAVGQ